MTDLALEAPAPGEPLKEYIDPTNREALDAQIEARHALIKAKLSKKELRRLRRRYARLHRILNRAQYNDLVTRRDDIWEQYVMVRAAYERKASDKLKTRGRELAAAGREINAKLAAVAAEAAEFADVAGRLTAHERVLQIEREDRQNRDAFHKEAEVWEEQIRAVFRQSPRLHYVYRTDRSEQIRIPQIQRIIIKPDKMYFQIRTTHQSVVDRWVGAWRSALPYGVDVKALTCDETVDNLSAAVGRIVRIERSKRSQNLFYVIHRLDSADGIPNLVRYEQVVDHYPRERHEKTPWAAGVGEDRKTIFIDFEEYPHVLIAGTNGGGKSNLINQALSTIISMNSPDEVRVVLVDNKGGVELSHFNKIPHLLLPVVKSTEDVLPALKQVRAIMKARFAAFLDIGARSLPSFNARAKTKLPRIILVVDEMATILGIPETDQIHNELRVLSSQARAVGIHLIISTQHPSVDVLPGWVKTNMNLRVAAKMPHHTASQIIVDSVTAAILPDIPGRLVFRRGGYEQILQTPLIEDDGIARAVRIAREYPPAAWQLDAAADGDSLQIEVDATQVFGPDEFVKIALEHCHGRLSAARVHEHVSREIITLYALRKMAKELIADIQRDGYRYELDGAEYQMRPDGNTYALKVVRSTDTDGDSDPAPEVDTPETVNSADIQLEEAS